MKTVLPTSHIKDSENQKHCVDCGEQVFLEDRELRTVFNGVRCRDCHADLQYFIFSKYYGKRA